MTGAGCSRNALRRHRQRLLAEEFATLEKVRDLFRYAVAEEHAGVSDERPNQMVALHAQKRAVNADQWIVLSSDDAHFQPLRHRQTIHVAVRPRSQLVHRCADRLENW